jgi:oxygen-dependent protoporphyrinogen oxidase
VSNVLVTEARDRGGSNITTVQDDGFLWEEGPNSFQPNDSMFATAIDSGLKDELVLGDPQISALRVVGRLIATCSCRSG